MPDFAVRTAFTAVDKISPAFRNMESSASSFQKTASRAFMAVGTLVSGYLINSFIEAAASAERMNVAFGSVFGSDAASQMGFVRDEAKRLGLDLQASADAYKSISAAAKGSAISNAQVKEVFIGVSEGAAALQLSSEQTSGALTALSQMISKGKVQAEELRGQLGERIPGAFQIAARAMNMTTGELDKFMSDGKLTAELFIPRFAAQMRKEFGPAAMDAANSFSAARNRFNNSVFDFKVGVGSVLLPALSDLMSAFMPVIDVMGQFFRENREGISAIIKVVPWLVGGFIAWKVALYGIATAQAVMNIAGWVKYLHMMWPVILKAVGATNAWGVAQWAINAAMTANPIGLIIVGIGALIAAGVALYRNWDVVKQFFVDFWNRWQGLITLALLPLWPFIQAGKMIIQAWGPVKEFFGTLWDYIIKGVEFVMPYINKIAGVVNFIGNAIGTGLDAAEQGARALTAPNRAATELQAGNTNVNIYSNGTEAKAEVTPRRGATVNMNTFARGYQQ